MVKNVYYVKIGSQDVYKIVFGIDFSDWIVSAVILSYNLLNIGY